MSTTPGFLLSAHASVLAIPKSDVFLMTAAEACRKMLLRARGGFSAANLAPPRLHGLQTNHGAPAVPPEPIGRKAKESRVGYLAYQYGLELRFVAKTRSVPTLLSGKISHGDPPSFRQPTFRVLNTLYENGDEDKILKNEASCTYCAESPLK
jgi:hypothetical protein